MTKTESMSINEFMSRDFKLERTESRRNKIKLVVTVSGITLAITFSGLDIVNATSGIDIQARKIYDKLLTVGKWIIVIKGGIDTINHSVQGDFDTAKKSFLSYLIVYLVLNGLPWAMDEVDKVFNEL